MAPKTGSPADIVQAQRNATERAKSLFLHVVQTYYENLLPSKTLSTTQSGYQLQFHQTQMHGLPKSVNLSPRQ
ncbi:hypothetical protein L208DRAFT_1467998 [Tricholoma matsutake]|nr:hypothetical protein L208DRAFT_1467998 [Tricholoma matsutake 945]